MSRPLHRHSRHHWKSLYEAAGEPDAAEPQANTGTTPPEMSRRTLVKLLSANMAVLGATGCGEQPAEEIVGYVERPEAVTPGVASFYATAVTLAGYGVGALGETREGRPIRLRGNPDDPVSQGASTALLQAAVYDLYDPDRLQAVTQRGQALGWHRFEAWLMEARAAWTRDNGAGLRLLTGRVTSPTVAAGIETLRRQFPEMRWHVWEPVDRSAVREGATIAFGEAVDTAYHLSDARRILSLDADFLGVEEPAGLRLAREFAEARKARPEGPPPARLYAVASVPGLTSAKADHRLPARFSFVEPIARAIAARLGLPVGEPSLPDAVDPRWIDTLVADLKDHRGAAVAIPGYQQPPAVHALAHAINEALGAVGSLVTYHAPVAAEPDGGLSPLLQDIDDGRVDTLFVLDGNPVYDAPADAAFRARMEEVETTIYWGLHANETAAAATWVLPAAHELESWGDARGPDGTTYLRQPLIRPLHGGRGAIELLAMLGGDFDSSGRDLLRRHWRTRAPELADDAAWRAALRRGTIETSAAPSRTPALAANWTASVPASATRAATLELQFRPHPLIWDGRFANNGWLQELPEALTKLVWGNAALLSPALAAEHGLQAGDVVRLELDGRVLEAPVWPMPSHPDGAVTLQLGYGRSRAGRLGTGVGVDAYRLRQARSLWAAAGLRLMPTGRHEALVTTQKHHDVHGRDLLREVRWNAYADGGYKARQPHEEHLPSLYPEPRPDTDGLATGEQGPHAWGMVIDYDACIGCNACVTACQSENNIPIVGKDEVRRGREMFWLRIDRYYSGPPEDPDTALQPVPCMHCENAPCEYVCPVEATQHSSEGLNEMIYNRCIGTRYCSQNCPYKVRRFNWFDYTGPDTDLPFLEALQNPDVTVRSRGVMEKCTYCVQRIERARIAAGREQRPIAEGEVETACQEACPTRAIVFGDLARPDSAVAERREDRLNYGLLEELNTRPRTTYLAKVRDPNAALEPDEGPEA